MIEITTREMVLKTKHGKVMVFSVSLKRAKLDKELNKSRS